MNVKLFRLQSGEEILARFEETDTYWILKDPAILIPMRAGQLGMMPWLVYAKTKNGVQIPKSFVVFTLEPVDDLKTQYDSHENKGIVAPSGSIEKPGGLKLTT